MRVYCIFLIFLKIYFLVLGTEKYAITETSVGHVFLGI